MKEKLLMARRKGLEHAIFQREVDMKENGKMIACMAMENYFIQTENLHMKVNGQTISFTAEVKSSVLNQSN